MTEILKSIFDYVFQVILLLKLQQKTDIIDAEKRIDEDEIIAKQVADSVSALSDNDVARELHKWDSHQ